MLVDKCNKYFNKHCVSIIRKDSSTFETDDLFQEIKNWLKVRNTILHSFAKSNPGMKTMEPEEFINYAIQTSENGLKLTLLLKKWFNQQKFKSKK